MSEALSRDGRDEVLEKFGRFPAGKGWRMSCASLPGLFPERMFKLIFQKPSSLP